MDTQKHSIRSQFLKGASGTFFLKITATGFGFITGLILARLLKAEGLGVYSYAMAWVFILGIPAMLGLQQLLVREVSSYCAQNQWGLLRGLISYSKRAVIISSTLIVITAAVIVWIFWGGPSSVKLKAFLIALLLVPVGALSVVYGSILRGFQKIVISQLPEMVIKPMLFLLMVIFWFVIFKNSPSPVGAIVFNLISSVIAVLVLRFYLIKHTPYEVTNARPEYRLSLWLKSGFVLLMLTGMGVINARTDIVMLGAMKEAKTVGLYSVATSVASLVTFVLLSVNTSFGPLLTRLYKTGQRDVLQKEITYSARVAFAFTLPIAICLILFRKWILLLYGSEFTDASTALVILCLAQLFNVAAGSVGLILVMTGHEKEASIGFSAGAVANVILNLILIPKWSKEGAAIATAISTVMWNLVMAWFVWKKLGLYTTALGDFRRILA